MGKKLLFTLFLLFICLGALFMDMNSAPDAGLKKKKKRLKMRKENKCGRERAIQTNL